MIERLRFDDEPDLLPPHSLAAEEAVLGSVLLDREVIGRVSGIVSARDFYRERNGTVFAAMLALHDRADPIDYLTLVMELERTGKLESIGGTTYVAELLVAVPTPIHAEQYARAIAETGARRRLISVGGKISALAWSREHDLETTIEKSEALLLDVAAARSTSTIRPMTDLVSGYIERLELARSGQAASAGVPTGFFDLDRILQGGLKRSDLVILAARPGLGKTSLATGIAAHVALRLKGGVAIFSLEMSAEQIHDRVLSSETGIEAARLVHGPLSDGEELRLGHALGPMSAAEIVVDDDPEVTPSELRSRVRRIQTETPLDLIIVDHISIMQGSGVNGQNRVQEMDQITRQLKALAKEQHIPVLALCQLSRAVEQRSPKIPMLSDLRDSGSIEANADVVVFIYREDKYDRDSQRQGVADLIVAKHRNGPTGQVSLLFNERTTKFLDLEARQEGGPWWTA